MPKLQFGTDGHVFHLFVVEVENRDLFMEYCEANAIGLKIHYPQPPHLSNAYKYLGYHRGDFPVTEYMADHIITLPLYNGMPSNQIDYVIEKLNFY